MSEPTPRLAISIPNIRQDSAMPENSKPTQSKSPRAGSRTSSMNSVTSTMPSMPIGTLM